MAVTPSFTPQKVINAARLRHPSLTELVIDDPTIVDDYNHATRVLVTAVVKTMESAFMEVTAGLVVVGADGSFIDLNFPEGELVGVPKVLDATKAAAKVRVLLSRDIEQREAMRRELIDDTRPGGVIVRDRVNNRWRCFEVINWTGVTALAAYTTVFPVEVVVGTLNTQVLLPFIMFGPLVEQLALELSHRADISADWMQLQQANIDKEFASTMAMFEL